MKSKLIIVGSIFSILILCKTENSEAKEERILKNNSLKIFDENAFHNENYLGFKSKKID